jgi:predicted transglutaminase-like cysteine proteinase
MTLLHNQSGKPHCLSILLVLVLISLVHAPSSLAGEFALSKQILTKIEKQYGDYARQRLVSWRNLINDHQQLNALEKLEKVNNFINNLEFVNDIDHWGQDDYWATPLQMLASNGGDCEDFSIAKYFTLREMGIPAERLKLTYVKALRLNQAHMVLTYYPSADADPLVLDNLVEEIQPASERDDLLPVYSFNGEGLWVAKSRGGERRVGKAKRLSRWQGVIARIDREQVPLSR